MKTVIYALDWTEFESGWGCRPDGLQIFLEYSELEKVLEADKQKRMAAKSTPYEYSIPTTKYVMEVDSSDVEALEKLITKKFYWFLEAGKRDISYLKKTYPSIKVTSTESL